MDFILVDLYAQHDAVKDYIRGWSLEDVLSWLRQFGLVIESKHIDHTTYLFHSFVGYDDAFYFTETGELFLVHPGWR